MKLEEIVITALMLMVLSYIYNNYRKHVDFNNQKQDMNLIKRFLIDEDSTVNIQNLGNIKKPIIWVHIEYNYNSRNWCSFGSRSSYELNMPYIYLTLQTIVNKCGDDFHICILDDYSFKKILPDFNIDLDKVGDPVKSHLRNVALLRVLHHYGGILMENSFICMKSLKPLQDIIDETDKPIVGEFINAGFSSNLEVFAPSIKLIGCKRECPIIKNFIHYLDGVNNRDFTAAQIFENNISSWLTKNIEKDNITCILGETIGTRINNEPVLIENLLTETDLKDKIDDNTLMVYVDRDEILNRTHYNWFVRLSPEQIFNSNTTIAELFLMCIS